MWCSHWQAVRLDGADGGRACRARRRGARTRNRVSLTPKQSRAKDAVLRWFHDPAAPQVFYLAGYGGTCKTFTIKSIVSEIAGRVLFAAFTGRAASVMRQSGCVGASTIHRLCYSPAGDPPSPESVQRLREELVRLRSVNEPGAQKTAERVAEHLRRVEAEEGHKGPDRKSTRL